MSPLAKLKCSTTPPLYYSRAYGPKQKEDSTRPCTCNLDGNLCTSRLLIHLFVRRGFKRTPTPGRSHNYLQLGPSQKASPEGNLQRIGGLVEIPLPVSFRPHNLFGPLPRLECNVVAALARAPWWNLS